MIFEIISGGEKTDWVGKEWAGLFFPRGKNGPAHSFPGEKTDWGEIPACYTGIVFVREFPSSPETRLNIVKDQAKIPELLSSEPELISPPGLSPERAWYLYENVRQHCEGDNNKDSTCPKPSVPKPRSMKAHPSQDPCPCKND